MSGLIKMGSYYVPIASVDYFKCDDEAQRCTAFAKRYHSGMIFPRDVSTKTVAQYNETKAALDASPK